MEIPAIIQKVVNALHTEGKALTSQNISERLSEYAGNIPVSEVETVRKAFPELFIPTIK